MADRAKPTTIDEYIATFPEEVRGRLQLIRLKVRELAPEANEEISYGIPTFKLAGRYLVYFAGWKNYISMYPLPEADPEFETEISRYKAAKSTARFPHKQPLPLTLIERLIYLSIASHHARKVTT